MSVTICHLCKALLPHRSAQFGLRRGEDMRRDTLDNVDRFIRQNLLALQHALCRRIRASDPELRKGTKVIFTESVHPLAAAI